jgi:hypothetical protein
MAEQSVLPLAHSQRNTQPITICCPLNAIIDCGNDDPEPVEHRSGMGDGGSGPGSLSEGEPAPN